MTTSLIFVFIAMFVIVATVSAIWVKLIDDSKDEWKKMNEEVDFP